MESNDQLSNRYEQAAETILSTIQQAQYQALKKVNSVQLSTYFSIGKYVSLNSRNGFWGTGALASISEKLQKKMPGLRGFSATQLKYMRMFYEEWNALDSSSSQEKIAFDKSSVTTDEIVNRKSSVTTDVFLTIDCQIDNTCQSLSTNFSLGDFLAVPFTHHCRILDLCHDQSECIYYIHRCAKDHLTAKSLIRIIKENEFHNYNTSVNF